MTDIIDLEEERRRRGLETSPFSPMASGLVGQTDVDIAERSAVYGDPTDTFARVAQVWSGILGTEVNASDVPLCMIGLKMVRAAEVPDYSDNSDDIAGYLEIFRQIVGPDMIHARSVEEYLAVKTGPTS